MKNKVFGYVLRPKVQSTQANYLRRGPQGWHPRLIIGNATVVKLRGNAERLAAQLDAEAVPVYGDPRKLGGDSLTPKCLWLIRLKGRGPVEVFAHRVAYHPGWKSIPGLQPVYADGDPVALPYRAKVTGVEKAPEGYLTREQALRDCGVVWGTIASLLGASAESAVDAKQTVVERLAGEGKLHCRAPQSHCPCCEYVAQNSRWRSATCYGVLGDPNAQGCPLAKLWPNGCLSEGAPYTLWRRKWNLGFFLARPRSRPSASRTPPTGSWPS